MTTQLSDLVKVLKSYFDFSLGGNTVKWSSYINFQNWFFFSEESPLLPWKEQKQNYWEAGRGCNITKPATVLVI